MRTAISIVGYVLLFGGFVAVWAVELINANETRRVVYYQKAVVEKRDTFTRDEVQTEMDKLGVALRKASKGTFPCAFAMLSGTVLLLWCRDKKEGV